MASWSDDEPGPYHSLIDAERAAAEQDGKPTDKISLIKRLREAAHIDLREAKDAVEDYLSRVAVVAGGKPGWVDRFLDAERAAADREGRSVSSKMLIAALREASGLDASSARVAVGHYLKQRGGNLTGVSGLSGCVSAIVMASLILVVLVLAYLMIAV